MTYARLATLFALLLTTVMSVGCASDDRPRVLRQGLTIDEGDRIEAAMEAIAKAEKAVDKGDSEEAIEYYQQAIESYSNLHVAWNDLGVELMKLGRSMDAAEAFRIAATIEPTDPRPYYNLGTIYQNLYYDSEALKYYRQAIERRPNYLPALRGAIQAAELTNEADMETLDWINEAILLENDPDWLKFFQSLRLRIESRLASEDF